MFYGASAAATLAGGAIVLPVVVWHTYRDLRRDETELWQSGYRFSELCGSATKAGCGTKYRPSIIC